MGKPIIHVYNGLSCYDTPNLVKVRSERGAEVHKLLTDDEDLMNIIMINGK
jgi:hypothetical protein